MYLDIGNKILALDKIMLAKEKKEYERLKEKFEDAIPFLTFKGER